MILQYLQFEYRASIETFAHNFQLRQKKHGKNHLKKIGARD